MIAWVTAGIIQQKIHGSSAIFPVQHRMTTGKLGNMKPPLLLYSLILLTNVLSAQNRYGVLITEIMSDPSPQVGLPNNEWIELKNNSAATINLQGWRLGDAGGQSGPMPDFILEPGSYVVICTGSAIAALSAFGTSISVTSFPSLDNNGELLLLRDPNGVTIHAVEYSPDWFQNELKKDGGWTLEMIDTGNPCSGSTNWKASTDAKGGTPGAINSVNALNEDRLPPALKNAFTKDPSSIVLVFNEPLDSLSAATVAHYSMNGGINFTSAEALPPLFNMVELKTNMPLSADVIYNVTVINVTDCKGNPIGSTNKTKVGLASDAAAGDAVINEILFNPRSNAYDYVEIFNKSNKILDISRLYIANRSSNNTISSISQISINPVYLFPGDYIVTTQDADNLALNYLVLYPGAVFTRSSLPSFPDDEGFVLLLNQHGDVLDEVNYKDDWHFKLLTNVEGVSLERLDPEVESQNPDNWHSAASTAGFGTPGYQNSQMKNLQSIPATIEVRPKVFSPDNDGFDDIASVYYRITEPGYVANITIFDAAGRPVKNLVRNGTLSNSGYWNWDGLDDKGLKLPVGIYILYTEIFNLQGKKERFKNTVVLARRMN